MNGITYQNFLNKEVQPLLEDILLVTWREVLLQHEWYRGDYYRHIHRLDNNNRLRRIHRRGPIHGRVRKPDLMPCDMNLFSYMKTTGYCTAVATNQELRERIPAAAEHIRLYLTRLVIVGEVRRWLRALLPFARPEKDLR